MMPLWVSPKPYGKPGHSPEALTPCLADNPVRIRLSGSGYQATDRQTLVLLAAAWWEHALIDLQNGRREAEKTNYSRRFEKRTATGFKSRPPNFVKLACQA